MDIICIHLSRMTSLTRPTRTLRMLVVTAAAARWIAIAVKARQAAMSMLVDKVLESLQRRKHGGGDSLALTQAPAAPTRMMKVNGWTGTGTVTTRPLTAWTSLPRMPETWWLCMVKKSPNEQRNEGAGLSPDSIRRGTEADFWKRLVVALRGEGF